MKSRTLDFLRLPVWTAEVTRACAAPSPVSRRGRPARGCAARPSACRRRSSGARSGWSVRRRGGSRPRAASRRGCWSGCCACSPRTTRPAVTHHRSAMFYQRPLRARLLFYYFFYYFKWPSWRQHKFTIYRPDGHSYKIQNIKHV